jgi:hypothetical protein
VLARSTALELAGEPEPAAYPKGGFDSVPIVLH